MSRVGRSRIGRAGEEKEPRMMMPPPPAASIPKAKERPTLDESSSHRAFYGSPIPSHSCSE